MTVASSIAVPQASGPSPSTGEANCELTVSQLLDAYMAAWRGRDHARAHTIGVWRARLGELPVRQLDADRIADELEALASVPARRYLGRDKATGAPRFKVLGHRKPATLNRLKSTLSAALTWGCRRLKALRGWRNPCRDVPAEREHNAIVRYLTDDERRRLLGAAAASAWPKLQLLVMLALTTGARRGELEALRWKDVDLERGRAYVGRSKNGQPRVLPLVAPVVALLRRQPQPSPEAFVFCSRFHPDRPASWQTAWRRALALSGVACRFHDLRHSAASYLAMNGASLIEIADVLGHKQLDTTRRYAHLSVEHKANLVQRVMTSIVSAN